MLHYRLLGNNDHRRPVLCNMTKRCQEKCCLLEETPVKPSSSCKQPGCVCRGALRGGSDPQEKPVVLFLCEEKGISITSENQRRTAPTIVCHQDEEKTESFMAEIFSFYFHFSLNTTPPPPPCPACVINLQTEKKFSLTAEHRLC